jgi:hypothetical protein
MRSMPSVCAPSRSQASRSSQRRDAARAARCGDRAGPRSSSRHCRPGARPPAAAPVRGRSPTARASTSLPRSPSRRAARTPPHRPVAAAQGSGRTERAQAAGLRVGWSPTRVRADGPRMTGSCAARRDQREVAYLLQRHADDRLAPASDGPGFVLVEAFAVRPQAESRVDEYKRLCSISAASVVSRWCSGRWCTRCRR